MFKNLIIIVFLISFVNINHTIIASEKSKLIPLKKPKLTRQELEKRVLINILKPLPKPILKKDKSPSTEFVKQKRIKTEILLPKKKPTIAGINTKTKITKSKFYNKKDFAIAKKAISEMKKSNWSSALNISKKAKDKSIYNFIQWNHLITKGNKASFYDYLNFIDKNSNYPRIGRIKYLA